MLLSRPISLTFLSFLPHIFSLDTVDITGASKCGLTTKFLRNQLAPLLAEFGQIPDGLRVEYHAISEGGRRVNGSVYATCNNGWLECELSKLQTCAKKYVISKNNTEMLSVVICIQGQSTLEAGQHCLPKGEIGVRIQTCASSQEGEKLLIAEPFPWNADIWFPFIKINGSPSNDAKRYLKKVICELPSARSHSACRTH